MVKILMGCPTSSYHKYCINEYVNGIRGLTFSEKKAVLVDNSKDDNYFYLLKKLKIDVIKCTYSESARDRIVRSRNILRDIALNEKLLRHKKDIVSGVYFARIKSLKDKKVKLLPLLWVGKKGSYNPYTMADIDIDIVMQDNFIKVKYCGLGCVLISRKALEKVKFRYDPNYTTFDDLHFCQDARDSDFEIYADTSVKCKHLILNRPWSWDEIKK